MFARKFGNKKGWKTGAAAIGVAAVLVFTACAKKADSAANGNPAAAQSPAAAETTPPPATQSAGGAAVAVSLGETDISHMFMKLDSTTAAAGPVTFTITNDGVKKHEFVVLSTDTGAADFKIASFEGEKDRMNEEAPGTENVGETGDMAPGSTKTLTIDLKPGHYALVCNLAGHYRMGMYSDFTVS